MESTETVTAAAKWLADQGLDTAVEADTTCCYAGQDKVWVQGTGQELWEVTSSKPTRPPPPSLSPTGQPQAATCCV